MSEMANTSSEETISLESFISDEYSVTRRVLEMGGVYGVVTSDNSMSGSQQGEDDYLSVSTNLESCWLDCTSEMSKLLVENQDGSGDVKRNDVIARGIQTMEMLEREMKNIAELEELMGISNQLRHDGVSDSNKLKHDAVSDSDKLRHVGVSDSDKLRHVGVSHSEKLSHDGVSDSDKLRNNGVSDSDKLRHDVASDSGSSETAVEKKPKKTASLQRVLNIMNEKKVFVPVKGILYERWKKEREAELRERKLQVQKGLEEVKANLSVRCEKSAVAFEKWKADSRNKPRPLPVIAISNPALCKASSGPSLNWNPIPWVENWTEVDGDEIATTIRVVTKSNTDTTVQVHYRNPRFFGGATSLSQKWSREGSMYSKSTLSDKKSTVEMKPRPSGFRAVRFRPVKAARSEVKMARPTVNVNCVNCAGASSRKLIKKKPVTF